MYEKIMGGGLLREDNDDVLDGEYDDEDVDVFGDGDGEGEGEGEDGAAATEDGGRDDEVRVNEEALLDQSVVVPFRLLFRLPADPEAENPNGAELVAHCRTTAEDRYRIEALMVDEAPTDGAEDGEKTLFAPGFDGLDIEVQAGFGSFVERCGVSKEVFEYVNLLATRHHATKMLGWMDSMATFAADWQTTVGGPEE